MVDFNQAIEIFDNITTSYTKQSQLSYKNLDATLWEFKINYVSKGARSCLKSLLFNFERNGGNRDKAISVEMIKQKCQHIAEVHRKKSLLSKGICALVRNCIINNRSANSNIMMNSFTSGTTLNRMLRGVFAESQDSLLDEFIQIERSL